MDGYPDGWNWKTKLVGVAFFGGIIVVTCMHCWPAGIYTQALMGMGIDEHAFWRRWMDDTKKHMVIEILG
jgi:hypothetical protein